MAPGIDQQDKCLAGIVLAGGLALGLSLVPTYSELGSHLNTDAEGIRAGHYLDRALIERGPLPEIVLPLAKIRGEEGRPGAGLALLDKLGAASWTARDRAIRRGLLRAAGRRFELAQELEEARRAAPSVSELDELARLYGEQQLFELQVEVLEHALKLSPGDARRTLDCARLRSSIGDRNRALELLQALWREQPQAFGPAEFTLLAGLAIELDPTSAPRELVSANYARFAASISLLDLGRRFFDADRLDDVLALLGPVLRGGQAQPEVVELWARTMILQGQAQQAASVLIERLADTPALVLVNTMLCEVALRHGDLSAALGIAERAGLDSIEGRVLVWLASAAAAARRVEVVQRILPLLTADLLASDPIGAANLYRVAGRPKGAIRWIDVAMEAPDLSETQRLWLAELCLDLGRPAAAATVLAKYLEAFSLLDRQALRVAGLWDRAKAAPRALALLAQHRLGDQASVLAGRALLLASAGRSAEGLQLVDDQGFVNRLLQEETGRQEPGATDGQGRRAVAAWLDALGASATTQGDTRLAVYCLRHRLWLRPGDRQIQWALASALMDDGQPVLAVQAAQGIARPLAEEDRGRYRSLLLQAYRAKAPVERELAGAAVAYLGGADLHQPEAQSWVHLLLELKAVREALPFVGRLAALKGGAWAARQVALLQELGATDEVLAVWRNKGLDSRATRAERLDAAGGLLAAGERSTAQRILQDLAQDDPPDSDVVRQLIFLWGPRPGPAAVQWLTARARASESEAQIGWLKHLMWVGAAAEVLSVVGADPPAGAPFALALDALVQVKRFADLADLAARRVESLGDPDLVQKLAEQCAAHGHAKETALAWLRLLALKPRHATALRFMAQWPATSRPQAVAYWEVYFQLPPAEAKGASWRDRVAYGEILATMPGRQVDAERQLQIALQLLEVERMPDAERDLAAGQLLIRLGRQPEAVDALARALQARPCDLSLRADLLALLLEGQQFDRAKELADPPARCADEAPPR